MVKPNKRSWRQQFEALRDGDRYFYENADPPSLVNQLNNTTLAQIIERNTGITNLQPNVFFFYDNIAGSVAASTTSVNRGHVQTSQSPLAGATVELIQSGVVVAATTTDSLGNYQFTETGAGQFTVKVIPPARFFGQLASLVKSVDITKGQQPGCPATANFVFGFGNNGGGGGWNPFTSPVAGSSGALNGPAQAAPTVAAASGQPSSQNASSVTEPADAPAALNGGGTVTNQDRDSVVAAAGDALTEGASAGAMIDSAAIGAVALDTSSNYSLEGYLAFSAGNRGEQ